MKWTGFFILRCSQNAKRYTADGEESITEFKDTDNLIIKGNNLIALHSLLPKYEGGRLS